MVFVLNGTVVLEKNYEVGIDANFLSILQQEPSNDARF